MKIKGSKTNPPAGSNRELPTGYTLLPGEVFVASDEADIPEDYFVGAADPDEKELDVAFRETHSLWFDIEHGVVKIYMGKDPSGKNIWTEADDGAPKYVLDFDTEDYVGMIVRSATFKAPVVIPPVSLDDLLDEMK